MSHSRGSWAACVFVAACATGFAQVTTLEGVSSQGIHGAFEHEPLALTADARFLLMGVRSSNLIPGDTNNDWDLYLRDRQNGAIERVSVATGGAQANDESRQGDVSADGRFVAFASHASNLMIGDSNGASDVFLRDRQLGTTTLVSRTAGGAVGNHASRLPAISADGRWVAFLSLATDLVAVDTNASEDVFVYDAQTSAIELVSVSSAGVQADSLSFSADISGDGRFVVFDSQASNLIVGDELLTRDVFLRDRSLATTIRLSQDAGGVAANQLSERPAISEDGAFAAFESPASNLVAGDANGSVRDVFVVELASGAISLESVASDGTAANSTSHVAALSADGRYVAFVSFANNLAPGDTNPNTDVYLRDRQSSTTTLVSIDSAGVQGFAGSNGDLAVGAGPSVAFATTNALAIGDFNLRLDAFLRDLGVSVAPIEVYCTSKTNSLGCNPLIIPIGTPRAGGFDSFFLTGVGGIGNKSGLLFWGNAQASIPFGGGFLCVKSPKRTPVQNSGGSGSACNGTFSFHMTQAYMGQHGIGAGDTLHGQYWARDQGFAPPNNISLTNAAKWTVVP